MNRVDGVFDRAFAFREATAGERAARVGAAWPTMSWRGRAWPLVEHGVPEIDWARLDLAETLASLDIDHGVAPVADTKGGTAAGQARWNAFRAQRLARYADDRDDATLPGVSRMSAYLHYGMVSPLRLAREAHAAGAEKYLDELLVWRELAYHWCRHVPEHATLHALPSWARRTLDAHRGDPRAVLSAERLARGETGDRLWDLAQRSLVVHGELHNNLRMTWGKAVPFWSASPEQALERTLWLNNRFALDGCDPASYGGILWCLGLFDRAFLPERPVLGSVRERTTEEHARRLDAEVFARIAGRRPFPMRVAVIGAGIAGLACARTLRDHLVETVVFEKSRGAGGRMSTRRGDHGAFDHGAQYFTARDPRFASVVSSWCDEGVVARWHARFANVSAAGAVPVDAPPRFVGVPSMSAVCAHLARGGECVANTRVSRVEREGVRWRLHGVDADGVERDLGSFDAVLSTAPAPQTAALLSRAAPKLAQYASRCGMRATWALMLAFRDDVALPFDHAEISAGAPQVGDELAWVSRTSSKPGRAHDGMARWTVLARSEWSEERLERTPEEIAPRMVDAFGRLAALLGVRIAAPVHAQAHRWRFALASGEGGPSSAFDASAGIGMAGDWMRGTRVEDAYLSGISLAGRVLAAAAQRFATPSPVAVAVLRG
ncbi:MAG: FAD-dependent oxidoreductase [Planctomycetaceae bacterium]|nr:FAD-dependent oxidoreductase [Planctomycetaceae bacterium]